MKPIVLGKWRLDVIMVDVQLYLRTFDMWKRESWDMLKLEKEA